MLILTVNVEFITDVKDWKLRFEYYFRKPKIKCFNKIILSIFVYKLFWVDVIRKIFASPVYQSLII